MQMPTFIKADRVSTALFEFLAPLRYVTNVAGVQYTTIRGRLVLTRIGADENGIN